MATRDELLVALVVRYRGSGRAEKTRILDEFASATGHHRKHAMRLLPAGRLGQALAFRPERRVYHAAVREALIVLWEASDRICGKRLKAMSPTLLPAMERQRSRASSAGRLWRSPAYRPGVQVLPALPAHGNGAAVPVCVPRLAQDVGLADPVGQGESRHVPAAVGVAGGVLAEQRTLPRVDVVQADPGIVDHHRVAVRHGGTVYDQLGSQC